MGEEQHNAFNDVDTPPVRFAGRPVPVSRSPWSQPPAKLIKTPAAIAPGVYPVNPDANTPVPSPPMTPRESLARDFGGLRQITVANPAPRSGKTALAGALHAVFRQVRADVVVWDCEDLSGAEFSRERDRLSRSYRVLIIDTTGEAAAALDATDQLVVAIDTRLDSVRAAEAMLARLEASDQAPLARAAVVVVATVTGQAGDASQAVTAAQTAATAQRFAGRTRAVFAGADAWDLIAQAVADGL